MSANFELGPYDPCPCGSGEKYKFCCAAKGKEKSRGKYPVGTVARYGPDDKLTTKIVAGAIMSEKSEPILEKWFGDDVLTNPKVQAEIKQFLARHGVKKVVAPSENIGCPHEEGIDFPRGTECPICPWWHGKQGISEEGKEMVLPGDGAAPDLRPPGLNEGIEFPR